MTFLGVKSRGWGKLKAKRVVENPVKSVTVWLDSISCRHGWRGINCGVLLACLANLVQCFTLDLLHIVLISRGQCYPNQGP